MDSAVKLHRWPFYTWYFIPLAAWPLESMYLGILTMFYEEFILGVAFIVILISIDMYSLSITFKSDIIDIVSWGRKYSIPKDEIVAIRAQPWLPPYYCTITIETQKKDTHSYSRIVLPEAKLNELRNHYSVEVLTPVRHKRIWIVASCVLVWFFMLVAVPAIWAEV